MKPDRFNLVYCTKKDCRGQVGPSGRHGHFQVYFVGVALPHESPAFASRQVGRTLTILPKQDEASEWRQMASRMEEELETCQLPESCGDDDRFVHIFTMLSKAFANDSVWAVVEVTVEPVQPYLQVSHNQYSLKFYKDKAELVISINGNDRGKAPGISTVEQVQEALLLMQEQFKISAADTRALMRKVPGLFPMVH